MSLLQIETKLCFFMSNRNINSIQLKKTRKKMKLNKLAKLLISFAITATPLIFTSCSSGDDNNEENIDSPNLDKTEIRNNVSIENQLKKYFLETI